MNLRDLLDGLTEKPIIILVCINILITSYLGIKLLNKTSEETFTRIVVDHNSKEDFKAMKKEVCIRGLKSILLKEVDKKFVDYELANTLADADYTNFEVEDTESIHVDMRSDVVCTALLKYEDRTSRVFDIDIIEDRENASLLYFIQDINEKLVRERS